MNDIQNQIELNALFEDLVPMAGKKVAVFLGRFNPPTKGHYEVINTLKKFIREHKNLGLEANPALVIIGGSKSDADKKRNPLSVEEREVFMKASGKANGALFFSAPNAFAALATLREKGYEPIAVAGGSDRLDSYLTILDKHFKTPDDKPIKHYGIKLERDEEAVETKKDEKEQGLEYALTHLVDTGEISTEHVSASLARYAVTQNKPDAFAKIVGLEAKPALAKQMFNKIASAMKGE